MTSYSISTDSEFLNRITEITETNLTNSSNSKETKTYLSKKEEKKYSNCHVYNSLHMNMMIHANKYIYLVSL